MALFSGSLVAVLSLAIIASGTSLPGSDFEIDNDANLKVDGTFGADSLDWANVTEVRKGDAPTGRNDDSYAGGAKEDDTCPGTTTGSIPNNKSDLLTFGVYVEPGDPGFLNLFWRRVNEPSGTTLMDFELNQSSTLCANGVNPVRTEGDLLIEYKIEQGGATANIVVREWTGSAWGPEQDLTAVGAATGTINSSSIPAAQSGGLISTGSISPRTFGEAQLDLDFIFDEDSCQSFGSAFLKSRASDSFTSQLKDYIAPEPVSITNCGKVTIRKETTPDEDPNATSFGYTKSFGTDPSTVNDFDLTDDGVKTYTNVLFGTGYTVDEDDIPAGWSLEDIDCSVTGHPSVGVTPAINVAAGTVTFAIDNAADVLDCTYTNQEETGAIEITKTRKHADSGPGDWPHAEVDFVITGGDLPAAGTTVTTDENGEACLDGLPLSGVAGNYSVHEEVPDGYVGEADKAVTVNNTATCANGLGEAVTFENIPLTDITVEVNSQVDGGTASTIDCVDDADPPNTVAEGETDEDGDGEETASDLVPGTYTCEVFVDP